MNYPFDPHNTSQDNSRSKAMFNSDEFMMQQSSTSIHSHMMSANNIAMPNDMQKLFSYMKNVMSNPMLMDEMERFLTAKQSEKNGSFVNRQNQSMSMSRIQSDMRMPPDSYIVQMAQLKRPEPLRMGTKEQVRQVKGSSEIANNVANKKTSPVPSPQVIKEISLNQQTPLSSYMLANKLNKLQSKFNNSQQSRSRVEQKPINPPSKQPVSFQDIPIKSTYIAEQQFNNFSSGPHKLAEYPQNQSQYYQSIPIKPPKQAISKNNANPYNNTNPYSNKYVQAQQRPLHGTKKDFKELIKQQSLQSPFDDKPLPTNSNKPTNNWINEQQYEEYQNQDDENNQDKKPKKQFLKRGTRQYLSSAKDRKSAIKPAQQTKNKDNQQNLNNSRYATQKQRDKTPKRDVSQNRILSKRNTTNNNDKSVAKLKTKDNLNTSNNESFYDQRQEQTTKRSITPKNQRIAQKSKSPILPPKSNKPSNNLKKTNVSGVGNQGSGKKKNVFDDSSSSDEDNQQSYTQQAQQNSRTNNLMQSKKANQLGDKKANSYQPEKEFNMFSRQKKQEIIEGVYLTKSQLDLILQKYAPQIPVQSSKNLNASEQKFNQLRKKYTDLCNLVQKQKIDHEEQMQREKEEFQNYKQQEMQKMKNQKRVMQRQIKSSMPSQSQNLQKDKEQVQNLKKELQKEKQEHKKKEKTNKILIQKYKKENEDLKFRLQKLEEQLEKASSHVQNNFSSAGSDRQTMSSTANQRANNANDKSKSKIGTKDVSPAKGKMNKSSKALEQNEQEEQTDDKSYKKTVPLYKNQQDKKVNSPSFNQNNKKQTGSKMKEQNQNSDEQNLPTFKVDNKKTEQTKTKTQKKYQYVENSVQHSQNPKKQSHSTHGRKNSGYQNQKNVFADDSDEEKDEDDEYQEDYDQESGQQSGFFKSQPKYENLSDLMTTSFSIKNITPQMIQNLFRYQTNSEYSKYIQKVNNPKRIVVNSSKNGVDKKITNIYNDKSKQILFQNGVKKEIFEDGYTIIYFKNGDVKQKLTDGTILYYFNEKKVDQITLINGLNIYRFDNNQVQLHFDSGKYVEIRHPDGTIKTLGSPIN